MPRILIAIALCTLTAPAFAAGQPPAPSANPASSAHANALAGQASAARIEACTVATNALIDNLEKGNDKAATADFDVTMLANLGADKLAEVWQQVGGQFGKLRGRGMPQNVLVQNRVVITLPLRFEKGGLNAQVACDADGKIAGFFLRPAAAAGTP